MSAGTGGGGQYIVYSCPCLNIRIHLSTKYTLGNLDQYKDESNVTVPVAGWEFDLGMGGIVIEFNALSQSTSSKSGWRTTSCLNCNCGSVYSVATEQNNNTTGRVVIHENAICGQAIEDLKHDRTYSQIFNIKLSNENVDSLIPMPTSVDDVTDNKLVSAHQQIEEILNQNIEKIRIESKLRIEGFKRQEEKRTQELIAHAKLENNQLWSRIVQVIKEVEEKKSHVRFAAAPAEENEEAENERQEEERQTTKKLGFVLDEDTISSSLRNKNLDSYQLKLQKEQEAHDEEEEEEDMFNLDEELSEEEKEEVDEEENEEKLEEEKDAASVDERVEKEDLLFSSSLKKSISQIDQKFSWIKKKRNTSKYLAKDFDLKADFKRDAATTSEEDPTVSMFATSVPITIHYPSAEEEKKDDKNTEEAHKTRRDILAASFANYNYSYSDRLLSDQLPDLTPIGTMSPAQHRRKSLLTSSSSLIRPQLDSLVGKSLDTRGLMMKKKLEDEEEIVEDEEFDSSLPPHVWASMNSYKDEFQLAIMASSVKRYDE